MRQQKFLKKILKDLKTDAQAVQARFTAVRDSLTSPNNILVHLSLNKDKIDVSKIHEPWLSFVPSKVSELSPEGHLSPDKITPCHELIQPVASPKMAIVGVGSVESNYMSLYMKSINSPNHPDLAAINVLISYLTQLEGPLWNKIRGAGLSYNYYISLSSSDGLIALGYSRSTQLVESYNKTFEVVNNFINGTEKFDDNLLESAKASLIFDLIKREKSPAKKSMQSLMSYLRDLDINFNRELIKKVELTTKDDLKRVGPLYLKPLFEDPERLAVICCNTSKVEGIIKGMEELNCHFKPLNLEGDSFWNSIE